MIYVKSASHSQHSASNQGNYHLSNNTWTSLTTLLLFTTVTNKLDRLAGLILVLVASTRPMGSTTIQTLTMCMRWVWKLMIQFLILTPPCQLSQHSQPNNVARVGPVDLLIPVLASLTLRSLDSRWKTSVLGHVLVRTPAV